MVVISVAMENKMHAALNRTATFQENRVKNPTSVN